MYSGRNVIEHGPYGNQLTQGRTGRVSSVLHTGDLGFLSGGFCLLLLADTVEHCFDG